MRNLVWSIFLILLLHMSSAIAADNGSISQIKLIIESERGELKSSPYPKMALEKSASGVFTLEGISIKKLNGPIIPLLSKREIKLTQLNTVSRGPTSVSTADYRKNSGGGGGASGVNTFVAQAPPVRVKYSGRSSNSSNKIAPPMKTRKLRSRRGVVPIGSERVENYIEDTEERTLTIATQENVTSTLPGPETNHSPILVGEAINVAMDTPVIINIGTELLANDSDPEGESLSMSSVDLISSLSGSIVNNGNGTITYTPPAGVIGNDSFDYWVTDGVNTEFTSVDITIYLLSSAPTREQVEVGTSISSTNVSTLSPLVMGTDELYLAVVVHSDSSQSASTVSGLGLTWNSIIIQCSNKSALALEVWYAIGAPSSSEVVSATFSGSVDASQISVSRYSNVDVANPVTLLESANPLGVGVGASCDNTAISSKRFDYSFLTDTADALVVSAIGYSENNSFTAESYTIAADITSGSNPNATGLVLQELNAPLINSYTADGKLQSSTLWSSVSVLIRPSP